MTVVGPDGRAGDDWVIESTRRPDLETIDRIARSALAVTRGGGHLLLRDVAPELAELLDLLLLPGLVEGTIEVQRQPEGREQPLGVEKVEEEGHLGDLSVGDLEDL